MNHVHLRPTSVQPMDRSARQCNVNTKADKPFGMPSGEPTPNHDKVVSARNSCSTENAAKTNDVLFEQGLVERSINLHVTEINYACMHVTIIVLN